MLLNNAAHVRMGNDSPKTNLMASIFRRVFALVLIALTAFAGAATAQGVTTTGQIRGQVTDDTGAPLRAVQVVARNTETGLVRGAVSDADGSYTIRILPPGTYSLRAEMVGRAPGVQENVRVVVGNAATVNIALRSADLLLEGLVVTANASAVDATEGGVRQLVTQEQIDNLPSLGRDFSNFVTLSGLVAPTPEATTGGKFAIAGQRASQTQVQIDGVDAGNAFFGESRGGSRIPFVFSLESIKEFQIITNGYDVEFGRYSGGIVNVVTKGGTNDFKGSVYANYRGETLTGDNFFGRVDRIDTVAGQIDTVYNFRPEDYQVTQYSAVVSGPVVRNKAHYLISFDGQRRREPNLPITQQRFAPGGAADDPVVFNEVGRFIDILGTQYGIDNAAAGYAPFQTSNDAVTVFGRVDWSLNDNHRLTVRHNYSNFVNDFEFTERFDFIYGSSRAEEYTDVSNSFVTELQSVLGENTYNVLRFQYANEDRPRNGKDLRPALEVNLSNGVRIGYGGTFAAFQNELNERKFQLVNNFTHVLGDHTLKAGTNLLFTNVYNKFLLEGAGTYVFRNLDDLEAFRPSSFRRNIRRGGGVPTAEFDVAETAFYLQDEWRATPKLTATLGVRYDIQSFLDDPARVVEAERAFGLTSGVAPTDADNLSPRLALAYDVGGDGVTVLRAGAGYFYGTIPLVLGGNVLGTVLPVQNVSCLGSIADGDANAPPSPIDFRNLNPRGDDNPVGCAGQVGVGGVPTYSFWQPGFEYPETFKSNLGVERLIGDNTRVSADLIFSQSTNLYTVQNANLRDAQFQIDAEGGRRVYQPAPTFDPSAADATANGLLARSNLELAEVYINYNSGRARSYIGTVELNHNLTRTAQFGTSYTFTRAYDNSSFSCCTSSSGFTNPAVGAFGPNDIGGFGDFDKAWGLSGSAREHTFVFSGSTRLPFGFNVSGQWRMQSGRPWTPEAQGDLNGDGVRFNDRPFIFAPENLPLASTGVAAETERARYAEYLSDWDCLADDVGQVLERNTCRFPWSNTLNMRVAKEIKTSRSQRAEIQVDLFNVLNGLNSEWGRQVGIFSSNRNILRPAGFNPETQQILYSVPTRFGQKDVLGSNLLLQFQAQIGLKYFF